MRIVFVFYAILEYLGIWEKVPNILFLGLDDAGRTTLLDKLRDERLVHDQSTQYLNSGELRIGKIKFKAFDLGGLQIARRFLRDYYAQEIGVFGT